MLNLRRFDTLLNYEIVTGYIIKEKGYKGLFKKSSYFYADVGYSYIAISKKSAFAKKLSKFNSALKEMVEQGVIDKLRQKYTGH